MAVYANDLSGNKAQFFRRYQRERPEPVTILSNKDLEGAQFLRHAHSRLVDYHINEDFEGRDYTGFQATQLFGTIEEPTFAVLSTWNTAIPWAGGAWHSWTDLDNIEVAKQPFVDSNIFVVNEAYSLLHGWAEGSIKVADEILEDHFGVQRPWDFDSVDLNQVVLQTNSQECVEGPSEAGGEVGDGGGGGDIGSVLCFMGDSQVRMADGSWERLDRIQVGDNIDTGFGVGIVTEALVHQVEKELSLHRVSTEFGDLVGYVDRKKRIQAILTHPLLQNPRSSHLEWKRLA